jgi:hypothetical protein
MDTIGEQQGPGPVGEPEVGGDAQQFSVALM